MRMGLSDGETQSSLKQSPAPILFGKRAPAVLNRTPDPLSDSSIYTHTRGAVVALMDSASDM